MMRTIEIAIAGAIGLLPFAPTVQASARQLFEGRYGTLIRLGAIIAIAVFLVILVLGGLAILSQLSELMAA